MKINFKKIAPVALSVLSVGGFVGTVIFAIKAAPKAEKAMDDLKKDNDIIPTKDLIKTMTPIYGPMVITGIATITCMLSAGILSNKAQTSIAGAYALVENSYKKYRSKLKELYGDETDKAIREAIVKEAVAVDEEHCVYPCNGFEFDIDDCKKVLFFDTISERYFETSIENIMNAEYHLNRNMALRGLASINEFYSFIGIDKVPYGDDMGWSFLSDSVYSGDYYWLDFIHEKIVNDDGLEIFMLSCDLEPIMGFEDD